MSKEKYIVPEWPCADRVKCLVTTRHGGVSQGAYAGFNLADHVGDQPEHVRQNRDRLQAVLGTRPAPIWLHQVHGTRVVNVADTNTGGTADGSFAIGASGVCAVMTADCLPLLLADAGGTRVAALHAGWRGLAAGIIEQGVAQLGGPEADLLAYLGPAIGPDKFEVGPDVVDAFKGHDLAAASAFKPIAEQKWLADIYELARQRLRAAGVTQIYGGGRCTFTEEEEFYSYRRDHHCGRMASLIWIDENEQL